LPRGRTPRRTRSRRRREAQRRAARRVVEARLRELRVEELARTIVRRFRRDVERAIALRRVIREHKWGDAVRFVIHLGTRVVEYRFVFLYAPRAPAWLSKCETAKARLRGFDPRRDKGRPVYQLVRERVGRVLRRVYSVVGALGRVVRVPVVSRVRRLVLRVFRAIDWETLLRELLFAERKYTASSATVVFRIADEYRDLLQRDRWSNLPLLFAAMDEAAVLEAVYARRGVPEDRVKRVVEACSPYALAEPPRLPAPFAYHARRVIDRVTRELARRTRDPWQREYIAQYAKDVLNACDAEARGVFDRCIAYALRVVENEYDRTAYARVASRVNA